MSIIGILKIMEVQEDDMEVQEEAVLCTAPPRTVHHTTRNSPIITTPPFFQ